MIDVFNLNWPGYTGHVPEVEELQWERMYAQQYPRNTDPSHGSSIDKSGPAAAAAVKPS